jgi:hypothetical protein
MIIAISGYIGSGKDTVAKIIQFLTLTKENRQYYDTYREYCEEVPSHHPMNSWQIKKFAGKLKETVSLFTGIPVADLEKEVVKSNILGPEWNKGDKVMTVRQMLQLMGTEALRNTIHENIHVNGLFADYKNIASYSGLIYPNWIISDLRFPNEMRAVRERSGICMRINRGNKSADGLHESEIALDNSPFDCIIHNDGTIEELIEKVRIMLINFNIISKNAK